MTERKRHWVNKEVKAQVQAGMLCYICEQHPPTVPDGLGNSVYQPCLRDLQQGLKAHQMQGYHERRGR